MNLLVKKNPLILFDDKLREIHHTNSISNKTEFKTIKMKKEDISPMTSFEQGKNLPSDSKANEGAMAEHNQGVEPNK